MSKAIMVTFLLLTLAFIPAMGLPDGPDVDDVVKARLDALPHVISNPGGDVEEQPWWLTTSMDQDRDKVFDTLEPWLKMGLTVAVFVDYDHDPGPADVARLEAMGLPVAGVYTHVDAIGLWSATPEQVEAIIEMPGVVMVEPTGVPLINMDVATPNVKARESDEYSPWTAWESGYSGEGIIIAVMDTGQDNAHPGIAGK